MYANSLPDDSVNISKKHPLLTASKLLISFFLFAVIIYFAINAFMDYLADSMTPQQEVRLEQILSSDENISNTNNTYLLNITKKLTACSNLPYPIHLRIMHKKEINAFAAPGGVIYLTDGILRKIKSENALAFIIGHELGHFKDKDHLRGLGYKIIIGALSLISGRDYGQILGLTLFISSAKHSQSQEYQADAYGLKVMQCAYGTVNGAYSLFEEMKDGKEWRYFTANHPAFEDRLLKMKEISKKKAYNTSKSLIPLPKISF